MSCIRDASRLQQSVANPGPHILFVNINGTSRPSRQKNCALADGHRTIYSAYQGGALLNLLSVDNLFSAVKMDIKCVGGRHSAPNPAGELTALPHTP